MKKKIKARVKAVAEVYLIVTIHEDSVGNQEIEDIDEVEEVGDVEKFEVTSVISEVEL